MKVIVTGGSGVIGDAVIAELLERGHRVRLLSRNGAKDARHWDDRVEPWEGDVADSQSLSGSAADCDAVLHIAGIVSESEDATFQSVNVRGTANMLAEAYAAGVSRFVFVSSLGADTGTSDYHRSKLEAEMLVREVEGNWTIVRPGNVYGPGDEVISLILKMVRTLPAVPVIGGGRQEFQPVWCEDVARGLVSAVERDDLAGRTILLAGTETTTMVDVIERLSALTGRSPLRLPVPTFLAKAGASLSSRLGIEFPVDESKLTMLEESEPIPQSENDLVNVLGVTTTSLDEGLRRLAESLPEQQPSEGTGPLHRKRYFAEIHGCSSSASELFEDFRANSTDLIPIDFEGESNGAGSLQKEKTLTAKLPARGQIQMRVIELEDLSLTLATLEGHPLAGTVKFGFEECQTGVRFEVLVHERAATTVDMVVMETVGAVLQDSNWVELVERIVERSGGNARDGVGTESVVLKGSGAERVEEEVEDQVAKLHREGSPAR